MGDVTVTSAHSLPLPELAALFNLAYSDYPVPLVLDESGLQRHIVDNDIDLEVSRVAMAPAPVGFALIGRRGREAWVGGMGTVPSSRRRGVAERTLDAALQAAAAAGVEVVWLEVLEENEAARSLYQRFGFMVTRELIVCSLRDSPPPRSDWQPIDVDDARRWIAEHRVSREPWQRDDPVLTRMRDSGRPLTALGISSSGRLAAALVYTGATAGTRIVQMAADDQSAAAEGLRAAWAATGGPVVLVNFPAGETVAAGARILGIGPDHIQHEMRLRFR